MKFLVETIVPADEKKKQETHVLKSDGTTERLVQKRRTSSMHHHEKQVKQEREKREKRLVHHDKQDRQEKREKQESKSEKVETMDKPRLGRTLTSQEESILLPLLQGLLAANGADTSKLKHENTPFGEKEQGSGKKNSRSESFADHSDKSMYALN